MNLSNLKKSNLFIALIILFATIYLFWGSFSSFFFQDDWFSLHISNAATATDFFGFFIPRSDVIYFRPLGMQVPFFALSTLFGLQPLPFRLLTLIVHLTNGLLVFYLLRHLKCRDIVSLFGTFLYVTSSIHFITFYWAATFAFMLGTTWYLLAFLAGVSGRLKSSLLFFFLGLLTNELIITVPIALFFYMFVYKISYSKKTLSLFFLITFLYIGMRFFLVRAPTVGAYSLSLDPQSIIKNVRDYFLWLNHWPEEIHNQFRSFMSINPIFWQQFSSYLVWFITTTFVFGGIVLLSIVQLITQLKNKKGMALTTAITFMGGLSIISLMPVLFFSGHAFPYYLSISCIGYIAIVCIGGTYLVERYHLSNYINGLLFALGLLWFISSAQNVRFNTFVHWAPRRAQLSEKLVKKITTTYPQLPQNATVWIEGGNLEESMWALSSQNALNVLYASNSIITEYYSLSTGKIDKPSNVFSIIND